MLTENEERLLTHVSMWGAPSYPIRKLAPGRWVWEEFCGIKGAPVVYKTKRAATEAFERFYDLLIDRKAGRA